MKKEKRSKFTILAKNVEELVIGFETNNTARKRNILIWVFILLTIGALFVIPIVQMILNPADFIMTAVFVSAGWISFCWGIAGLVYVIARYIPHRRAIVINRVEGTLWMISCYPFRKEEKIETLLTREIQKIYIHEVINEGGRVCSLKALMQDGRQVTLYTNPHFETINQLDTLVKDFIGVLR